MIDTKRISDEIGQINQLLAAKLPVERLDRARNLVNALVGLTDGRFARLEIDDSVTFRAGERSLTIKFSDRYRELMAALKALYRDCGVEV